LTSPAPPSVEVEERSYEWPTGKPTPEANFKLSVASALGLLDLAGAIRENGRARDNS
jgi:hypothetical protein